MFSKFLGEIMEVYIDNMLVKSFCAVDHVQYFRQAFDILNSYQMKLNLENCTFRVSSG